MLTTEEVADRPAAVATAFKEYDPGFGRLPVTVNGVVVACPSTVVPEKYDTFVTVPPLTEAEAFRLTLAGAAKTAPLVGELMLTVGEWAAGAVERVYETVAEKN
jgi:hypothetical protein